MLVVGEENLLKIHIHTNHPGKVLETCLQFGSLSDVKSTTCWKRCTNNIITGREISQASQKHRLVAVGVGEGIIKMLRSLGVDEVVEGGQNYESQHRGSIECLQSD